MGQLPHSYLFQFLPKPYFQLPLSFLSAPTHLQVKYVTNQAFKAFNATTSQYKTQKNSIADYDNSRVNFSVIKKKSVDGDLEKPYKS